MFENWPLPVQAESSWLIRYHFLILVSNGMNGRNLFDMPVTEFKEKVCRI
jgi:hypothetical protein